MGPLAWIAMGFFWLILLGLIVWLVTRLLPASGGETTRPARESPLEVLDRRLASGEIDLDTWQTQRVALLSARGDAR
ncbi:MAG: hypothetical protein ABI899_04395 [Actinomycetota bacterium]